MNSIRNLRNFPASQSLLADDILEFHAARLLLLLQVCGTRGRIEGLTKLAKLDFFVRYPRFFARVSGSRPGADSVESAMIRHHYGPWDKRYYHVLAYLESHQLVGVSPKGKGFEFRLTQDGNRAATALSRDASFADLVEQMRAVKKELSGRSGNALKNLIYREFEDEIAARPLGEVIDYGG